MSAPRWQQTLRPFVRQLYLRVHPDLFGGAVAGAGPGAREGNERSMADLEGCLLERPREQVALSFHVLCAGRREVQRVANATVLPARDDVAWRRNLASALHTLLEGIASPQGLAELERSVSSASGADGAARGAAEGDKAAGKGEKAREREPDWRAASAMHERLRREVEVMARPFRFTRAAVEWVAPEDLARQMFRRGQVRCAANVQVPDAIEFILATFAAIGPSALPQLTSPLFADIVMLVAKLPTGMQGSLLTLCIDQGPDKAADALIDTMQTFEDIYHTSVGSETLRSLKRSHR
jgi:hypothetical protein